MNTILEHDQQDTDKILAYAATVASRHFARRDTLPPGQHVEPLPPATLPDVGMGAIKTLDHFDRQYAPLLANSSGPRYFGFVTGGATPAAVAADWLVSAYDQNTCGNSDSIAPRIEQQTIDFMRQLFQLDDAYFGSFVTGATMANFVGLVLGRQWVGEQRGRDISADGMGDLRVRVVSGTAHSSTVKAMAMAGMGRKALTRIPVLPGREAIDVAALEAHLANEHDPVIVVANAGTVNTVDFDDLEAIGKLKEKYKFWLHVDAAFGGFAALSKKFAHLMQGINAADSITIDAHKWLNVPYDAGMQFTRHRHLQLKIFQNSGAYLSDPDESPDFFHFTPESSRRFRALPAWFTLMAYGKDGHRDIVERNCACAQFLGEAITQSEDFTLLAPVRMNVVCFTPSGANMSMTDVRNFLHNVRNDGRVFFTPTIYKNQPAIRAAVSNWQTEIKHMKETMTVLTKVWQEGYGHTT